MNPSLTAMGSGDTRGLMEAVSNLESRELDLILHSPGGTVAGAETMVQYLRKRFDHIRVIVPLAATSAATMVALAADEIVMGQHSHLGPIDPQFVIQTPEGSRSSPAQAILKQFEQAKEECKDPSNLAAWMPILRTYSPGLLQQCVDSRQLAETLVADWLEGYMFRGEDEAGAKARETGAWFANYDRWQSHARPLHRDQIRAELELNITDLEDDDEFQDLVLSVHHCFMHTFSRTPAVKIIENHTGRAWVQIAGQVLARPANETDEQKRPQQRTAEQVITQKKNRGSQRSRRRR